MSSVRAPTFKLLFEIVWITCGNCNLLAMSLSRLGSIDPEPGNAAGSLAILREAIGLLEPIATV